MSGIYPLMPQGLGTGDSPAFTDATFSRNALTVGTMTYATQGVVARVLHKFTWTNVMVVALGAALTGDITICTLPAKTRVVGALVVITGAATGPATLSVSVGRTSALYIDYVVASDAKAAAYTVYGDALAELGTNMTFVDIPSYTGATAVKAHFIATISNLDQTLASTGIVYLETVTLP